MGQFALVKDYGIAGGARSKHRMCVKPDLHVRRVTYRLGLVSSERTSTVVKELTELNLESPADFDLSVWRVGQQHCHATNPGCDGCPLRKACDYASDALD